MESLTNQFRKLKGRRKLKGQKDLGSTANSSLSEPPTNLASNRQETVIASSSDGPQTIPTPPRSVVDDATEKYGLFLIHPTNPAPDNEEDRPGYALDIVAVHGITGSAYNTWTHSNGTFWLKDIIPKDFPGARVFSYAYPADVFCTFATGTIRSFATSLLEGLKGERRSKEQLKRPIIFICHSMGGIVVKEALVLAKIEDELFENIRISVKGILFLATPHRGSGSTQFPSVLTGIANLALTGTSRFVGSMRLDLIKNLKKDSKVLEDIATNFRKQTSSLQIASFIEQDITPPLKSRIVDDTSGIMNISNERIVPMQGCDHRSICRFAGKHSESYKRVSNVLQDWVDELDAPDSKAHTLDDTSCLRSLAFPEVFNRREEVDKAYSHTCGWILEHKSYKTWRDGHGLLWLKGKPGSGKSTLMAFIYDKLQRDLSSKQSLNLEFFFHGRGTILQKTPIGMFRSLLYQIYDKVATARPPVLAAFRERKKIGEPGLGWEWQRNTLKDLFSHAFTHAAKSRPITLFVDALDEAGAETASELAEYFHELNKLVVKSRNAKICISCRHYPVASNNISLEIHVEDENHNDIAKYVEEKLDTERPDFSAEEYQALKKTVVGRASGSFMWARLSISMIIRSIRDGESLAVINDELCKVPSDLGDVYEYILKTIILAQNRKRTLLLMQWVCFAERPLSVTELRYAIASDNTYIHKERQFCKDARDFVATDKQMQKQLTSWSGGLVEARRHGDTTTVQFIHQTVNDFLRSEGLKYLASAAIDLQPRPPGDLSADIVIGQSHDRLCKSCVNYLRLDEVLQEASLITPITATTSLKDRSEKTRLLPSRLPFILYAAESWYLHAEKAEGFGILQKDLVQQLNLPPQRVFQSWISISRALIREKANPKCPEMGSTILHIASGSNLRSIIQVLLNDNWKVDTRDNIGNTALHYAARWGHTDLVKMLLDARAELDAENNFGSTALERAAVNGHEDTLRLLLHRGADVNSSTGKSGSALQAAAGEEKYIVVQLLLDSGANINAQGGHFGNALQAAASSGSVQMVELLLSKGADINTQGGNFGNALQAAVWRGSVQIVELLLSKGADINTQGGHFGTALQAAVSSGSVQMVELLLSKGANINTQGGNFGNALQAAAWRGSVQMVELLLSKGADINTQGGNFGNALKAAVDRDSDESAQIVELLMSKGAK
ncbi:hypothetical protein BGZ57DRAFT_862505 [Hyaloscypha finlandica]|nr:hypothetical protein BGZ57DRAFT_862505 [Hyaloscypha finlandica]